MSRKLQIHTDQTAQVLARCVCSGLVRSLDHRYRYSPRTATLGDQVDELARLYPAYRLAVISVTFARPTAPIRDFSEAFDLRPPKKR